MLHSRLSCCRNDKDNDNDNDDKVSNASAGTTHWWYRPVRAAATAEVRRQWDRLLLFALGVGDEKPTTLVFLLGRHARPSQRRWFLAGTVWLADGRAGRLACDIRVGYLTVGGAGGVRPRR